MVASAPAHGKVVTSGNIADDVLAQLRAGNLMARRKPGALTQVLQETNAGVHVSWRRITRWSCTGQGKEDRQEPHLIANSTGLSGTFVVNGSPTKTQIVDDAGGRSQLSLLVMSAMVALILLFLTGALTYLPEAALSAIVFLIGVGLIDVAGMRRVFDQRRSEFWLALITALTVVIVGVEQGILLAIALSLISHTRYGYQPKNAVLLPSDSGGWQPVPVAKAASAAPGLVIYRFTHSMYYANCRQLAEEISFLADTVEPPLRWLCIDASADGRCRLFRGGDHPVGVREVEGERNTAGRYGNHG